jgi:integrase
MVFPQIFVEETTMYTQIPSQLSNGPHIPWNKGRLIEQVKPLKHKEIWAIRIKLLLNKIRDLALFNLAIDSKLRGCDIVSIRGHDIIQGGKAVSRAMLLERKTQQPVRFELMDQTRESIEAWLAMANLRQDEYLFPSRKDRSQHITTRQYGRIVKFWVGLIDLDANEYGTHSLRRTKAILIYRRTKKLRAVQLQLGHTKLESTVRYLGIEVDDALEISEQTEG